MWHCQNFTGWISTRPHSFYRGVAQCYYYGVLAIVLSLPMHTHRIQDTFSLYYADSADRSTTSVEHVRSCIVLYRIALCIYCFFFSGNRTRPLAFLQSSSYENRGTKWNKIRVFGMLQQVCAGPQTDGNSRRVMGRHVCGEMKCKTYASTRAPRHLGVSEKSPCC